MFFGTNSGYTLLMWLLERARVRLHFVLVLLFFFVMQASCAIFVLRIVVSNLLKTYIVLSINVAFLYRCTSLFLV